MKPIRVIGVRVHNLKNLPSTSPEQNCRDHWRQRVWQVQSCIRLTIRGGTDPILAGDCIPVRDIEEKHFDVVAGLAPAIAVRQQTWVSSTHAAR